MSTSSSNNGEQHFEYHLYHYIPSLPAAIIAIIIYALLTVAHCYRLIRRRTWFCIAFAVGGLFETIGYIGRAFNHQDNKARTPYIIQSLFILVAPALFAATIYMTLGRVIRTTDGTRYSIVPVKWMTKIFVAGDILSFFIQGGGGGIQASGDVAKVKMGEKIILGGLFLQIIMFGLFILISVLFHYRMRQFPTRASCFPDVSWQKMLLVLYAVSGLIMLRNIFRVAEYFGGRDGPLLSVEWPIYVFDMLLMVIMMAIFLWGYPSPPPRPKAVDSQSSIEMPQVQTAGYTGRPGA